MLDAGSVEDRTFADGFSNGRASSCAKGRKDSSTHGDGERMTGVGSGRDEMDRSRLVALRLMIACTPVSFLVRPANRSGCMILEKEPAMT